jgi:hypothetical protein
VSCLINYYPGTITFVNSYYVMNDNFVAVLFRNVSAAYMQTLADEEDDMRRNLYGHKKAHSVVTYCNDIEDEEVSKMWSTRLGGRESGGGEEKKRKRVDRRRHEKRSEERGEHDSDLEETLDTPPSPHLKESSKRLRTSSSSSVKADDATKATSKRRGRGMEAEARTSSVSKSSHHSGNVEDPILLGDSDEDESDTATAEATTTATATSHCIIQVDEDSMEENSSMRAAVDTGGSERPVQRSSDLSKRDGSGGGSQGARAQSWGDIFGRSSSFTSPGTRQVTT